MNNHPNECPECKILRSVIENSGHGTRCSQYVKRAPVPYGADGFIRTASGHIAGFATGNVRAPRVAAIGNGLFVRVGTGPKTRKTRRAA